MFQKVQKGFRCFSKYNTRLVFEPVGTVEEGRRGKLEVRVRSIIRLPQSMCCTTFGL